jgi:hypothetical protein
MQLGRLLIATGFGIALVGIAIIVLAKLHIPLGRLPGDILLRAKSGTLYFPWVTCLALSLLATLVLWIFGRGSKN